MSSNKSVKERMIRYYGAKCFIEKLHLRKDTEKRKYKSSRQRAKMKQLTYHHIQTKKDGGETTVENGALLSRENHTWFHRQSEEAQAYMNSKFQEYKKLVKECEVVLVDHLDFKYTIRPMEFRIEKKKKEIYDRSKEKEKFRKEVEEEDLER